MKKIIVIIFLFAAVNVSAQDIPDDDTTSKPAITEIGKPDGLKAEMKIGKDGGSFISSDGKIKLIIPEGAVSKKTTFSIQPVTNLMPNGNGKAYRLEPSGIQFQKPVELVFHYDPEESKDSAQLLMGISMQDDKGQWYGLDEFTLDTVAKTISGNINHFSTWATFDKLKLSFIRPRKRIKVKKKEWMLIKGIDYRTAEEREQEMIEDEEGEKRYQEQYFSGLSPLSNWKRPKNLIWRVNGIIKGNAEVGTLEFGRVSASNTSCDYTAPANVPDANPVTISVELEGASFKIGGKTVKNPRLSTQVLIYDDAYEVTMESRIYGDAGSAVGNVTFEDQGSFVIELNGKKTKIIEKKNKNMTSTLAYKGGFCTLTTEKPGYGNIHIAGVPKIFVVPGTSTKPAWVVIQFSKRPSEVPILYYSCTDPNGTTYTGNTARATAFARIIPAIPIGIRFDAKEGEQVLPESVDADGIYFKVTVRQLEDNE